MRLHLVGVEAMVSAMAAFRPGPAGLAILSTPRDLPDADFLPPPSMVPAGAGAAPVDPDQQVGSAENVRSTPPAEDLVVTEAEQADACAVVVAAAR